MWGFGNMLCITVLYCFSDCILHLRNTIPIMLHDNSWIKLNGQRITINHAHFYIVVLVECKMCLVFAGYWRWCLVQGVRSLLLGFSLHFVRRVYKEKITWTLVVGSIWGFPRTLSLFFLSSTFILPQPSCRVNAFNWFILTLKFTVVLLWALLHLLRAFPRAGLTMACAAAEMILLYETCIL